MTVSLAMSVAHSQYMFVFFMDLVYKFEKECEYIGVCKIPKFYFRTFCMLLFLMSYALIFTFSIRPYRYYNRTLERDLNIYGISDDILVCGQRNINGFNTHVHR